MTRSSRILRGGPSAHAQGSNRPAAARRGVVLLEVVLALSLFFCGAMVILGALSSSLRTAQRVQTEAKAADLAVTLLSEIQMGLLPLTDDGPNEYEDETLVGWTWQIVVLPSEDNLDPTIPPLLSVEVIIHNERADCTYRLVQLMSDETNSGEIAVKPVSGGLGSLR